MIRFFVLLLLVYSVLPVQAAERRTVDAQVKEVTVYLSGARVMRTAQVRLVPGNNELVVEGLSDRVDEKSIEVQGSGNAIILSVNYKVDYTKARPKTEEEKKMQVLFDSLQMKLTNIKNEKAALESELLLLYENRKLGVNEKSVFVEDLEELADFHRRRVQDVKNRIVKADSQEKEYTQLINELQNQNLDGKAPSGEVHIKISSNAYSVADIRLSYFVADAGWVPVYSLRSQNINDQVKLDYDGLISQQTGETWKDVKLTLATGNPALGGNRPVLDPWYLGFQQQIMFKRGRKKDDAQYEMDKSELSANDEGALEKPSQLGYASEMVNVHQNQLNTTFEIHLKYTIPSNKEQHQVRIQQYSLPAKYEYLAVPKMDNDAFLLAKVSGWEEYNLLPGQANLFFEGTYVGKSFIDPGVTEDTLQLSFGRDKKINLDRVKLKDFSKKQLLGANKTETYSYEISLKNTKNTPITITVEDHIPVPETKEIDVELLEAAKADFDPVTGKLVWHLTMQPGDLKKLKVTYAVKYPKNRIIPALN
jgi:uncharacterized protein (TIGR02231 family)